MNFLGKSCILPNYYFTVVSFCSKATFRTNMYILTKFYYIVITYHVYYNIIQITTCLNNNTVVTSPYFFNYLIYPPIINYINMAFTE